MDTIAQNLKFVQERINKACEVAGRDPKEVKLLLATKTVEPTRIQQAFSLGYTLIAENKVQELKEKYEALKPTPHTNHFIGHLQTNKIKDILKCDVSCIESLDRYDLAGVAPEQALELVKQVAQFPTLHIKGLMTIGLFSAEEEKVRKCFQLLKNIQEQIIALGLPNVEPKELSMGMSGDLEIAIAEGATIVRVGTAIFGERIYPDSYYWNEKQA